MTHVEAYNAYRTLGELDPAILTPTFIRQMTKVRKALEGPAMRVQEELETHRDRVAEDDQETLRPEQVRQIEEAMQETREEPIGKDVPRIDPRGVTSTEALMALLELEELEPVFPAEFLNGSGGVST